MIEHEYKEGVPVDEPDESIIKAREIYGSLIEKYFMQGIFTTTGTSEEGHSEESLHYPKNCPTGKRQAEDFRFPIQLRRFLADLKAKLGPEYDVVLERDHLHLEFQPKVIHGPEGTP